MIEIDGTAYNVPVLKLARKAEFLDKFAQRTEDGGLERELIGVYFNYQLELGGTLDVAAYAALWDKLTEPVEFHTLRLPAESGWLTFTAYVAGVADELLRQGAAHHFTGLTVEFIAKSPARR